MRSKILSVLYEMEHDLFFGGVSPLEFRGALLLAKKMKQISNFDYTRFSYSCSLAEWKFYHELENLP